MKSKMQDVSESDAPTKSWETSGNTNTDAYPDGGKEAWLIVLSSWCAIIPSMGLLNSLAVLQAWLTEHDLHGLPESTTGWIFSTYAFFLFFCGAQIGPIFDSHDLRLFILPGPIGIALSLILMSLSIVKIATCFFGVGLCRFTV